MRSASYSGQFKRDVELAKKRGKDMNKLRELLDILLSDQEVPRKFGDHALKGEWRPNRDLHIEPDWILIYRICEENVHFERTGTHADIFGR